MASTPPTPRLTPQFCFSPTALSDFLRLSRSQIDDPISTSLNALLTPSSSGFDPRSTARRFSPSSHHSVPPSLCRAFTHQTLFPAWQSRTDALTYCANVAAAPDPDDPESLMQEVERERDRERVVDERLDPYSGRFFPRETRTELLAERVRRERGVEGVVRGRSWEVVRGKCGDYGEWEEAVRRWREETSMRR